MPQEFVALAVMGIDQHENGIFAVSRVLMESQIQVEYLGTCMTPQQVAKRAIELGVDVVGISCHSWEYMTLVPQLLEELEGRNANIEVILGGSVITPSDALHMRRQGVAAVFTDIADSQDLVDCVRGLAAKRGNVPGDA